AVRVLDPEDELAAVLAREGVVEQRRVGVADVDEAGRRGRDARPDTHRLTSITRDNRRVAEMDAAAIEPIARALVEVSTKVREGETALIVYDPPGAPLARRVARLAAERGARVLYIQRDQALEAEIAASCREREVLR